MARTVRCSLIQAANVSPAKAMVDKHLGYIAQAADAGAQIVCRQEIFNGPYFCAEEETRWYDVAEPAPEGPIIKLMQEQARARRIVLIVPVYEREQEGVYYNTAAVFDAGVAKIGIYICYDRHFPEGARSLGLNGAEIVFNPSATVAGLSEHLWKLEQPAHAVANGYYIAAINRVGVEPPWNIGEFDRRSRSRHDLRGPQNLAVLPRPPARSVRIARPRMKESVE